MAPRAGGDQLEGDRERLAESRRAVPVGRLIPAGGDLLVDAVAVLPLAEGGDQASRELRLRHHHGDELRRVAIEEIDPRIAALEEPLAEIGEAGEAGRPPAGEGLAAVGGSGVLAGRRLAAQAEHAPRLEQGAVLKEGLHRLLERLRGVAPHLAELAVAEGGRQRQPEIDLLPTSGHEMAQRMAVDPLPGLVDQELKGLADAFFTFGGGHGVLPGGPKMKTRCGGVYSPGRRVRRARRAPAPEPPRRPRDRRALHPPGGRRRWLPRRAGDSPAG